MGQTLTVILTVCLILITITNVFLATVVLIILFRVKSFIKTTEKALNIFGKIGSGWAKFVGVLLGLLGKIGFDMFRCSVKKEKKEEIKNV